MNRQTTRTKNRNAHLLVRVELETLHQPVSVGDVRAAVQAGEELERLRRGHRRPQRRLTRHVGDAAVGGRRVAPGVDPEELRPARRRAMQPEQQADRGRLAGPVGPEVAVNLALAYGEIQHVERDGLPVALGQSVRADGLHVRCLRILLPRPAGDRPP